MKQSPGADHLRAQAARIARLNRIQCVVLIGLLGLWLAGASQGDESKPDTVVKAKTFRVVDSTGKALAELGTDGDGSTGLFLNGVEDKVAGALVHDASQSALFLRDHEETIRVGAALFAHGGAGFALHGVRGVGGGALYYKGDGSLTFYDIDGTIIGRVPSDD